MGIAFLKERKFLDRMKFFVKKRTMDERNESFREMKIIFGIYKNERIKKQQKMIKIVQTILIVHERCCLFIYKTKEFYKQTNFSNI